MDLLREGIDLHRKKIDTRSYIIALSCIEYLLDFVDKRCDVSTMHEQEGRYGDGYNMLTPNFAGRNKNTQIVS